MNNHTKGPWRVLPGGIDDDGVVFVCAEDLRWLEIEVSGNARHENAKLIAASPNLLEALENATQYLSQLRGVAARLHHNLGLEDIIDECNAAITKAGGYVDE